MGFNGISGFSSVLGAYTPPFYNFPTSFLSAIAYRFNAKDTGNFALRVDGSNQFVTGYTDPISGIAIAQTVASLQPTMVAGGVLFDGVNDFLRSNENIPSQKEYWVIGNLNTERNFAPFADTFLDHFGTIGVLLIGAGGTKTLNSSFGAIKINNVTSFNFDPTVNKKSISVIYAGADYSEKITLGFHPFSNYLNGQISDVIAFNRVLTTGERAELQTYLQAFHSFTP